MAALGVARKQQKQILRANLPFLLAIEKYSLSGSYSLAIGFVKEYAFASVGGIIIRVCKLFVSWRMK